MVAAWPAGRADDRDTEVERDFAVLQDLVTQTHRFRSQNSIPPSARFELTVASSARDLIEAQQELVTSLAGLSGVVCVDTIEERDGTSTIQFTAGQAQVELAGLIDVDAELGRLRKERDKTQDDLAKVEGKLANASFVERAPEEVVARERSRREELVQTLAQIEERIAALETMEG
jgi:valyl-tRNA synthetase